MCSSDLVTQLADEIARAGSQFSSHLWRNTASGNLGGWQRLDELFAALEAEGQRGPVLSYLHMMPQLAGDQAIVDLLLRRKARTAPKFPAASTSAAPSSSALVTTSEPCGVRFNVLPTK